MGCCISHDAKRDGGNKRRSSGTKRGAKPGGKKGGKRKGATKQKDNNNNSTSGSARGPPGKKGNKPAASKHRRNSTVKIEDAPSGKVVLAPGGDTNDFTDMLQMDADSRRSSHSDRSEVSRNSSRAHKGSAGGRNAQSPAGKGPNRSTATTTSSNEQSASTFATNFDVPDAHSTTGGSRSQASKRSKGKDAGDGKKEGTQFLSEAKKNHVRNWIDMSDGGPEEVLLDPQDVSGLAKQMRERERLENDANSEAASSNEDVGSQGKTDTNGGEIADQHPNDQRGGAGSPTEQKPSRGVNFEVPDSTPNKRLSMKRGSLLDGSRRKSLFTGKDLLADTVDSTGSSAHMQVGSEVQSRRSSLTDDMSQKDIPGSADQTPHSTNPLDAPR